MWPSAVPWLKADSWIALKECADQCTRLQRRLAALACQAHLLRLSSVCRVASGSTRADTDSLLLLEEQYILR